MPFRGGSALGGARLAIAVAFIFGVTVAVVLATESDASINTVQISTAPALFPAFNTAISDYVVRCTGSTPVQVSVSNSDPSDTTTMVSVDAGPAHTGAFASQVSLNFGQAFKITATQGSTSKDYYVRCLPSGFPTWTTQRSGSPQAEYYVLAPSLGSQATRWVIVYDTNGVPIWWTAPATNQPLDAKLEQDGGRPDVLWTDMQRGNVNAGPAAEEHSLDGSFARTIHITSPYTLNPHEVQLLAGC